MERILFKNGHIITAGTPPANDADANGKLVSILVEGGLIKAIGPSAAMTHRHGCREIDLEGALLLPGLADSHGHIFWTGLQAMRLQLSHLESFAALVERVAMGALQKSPDQWLVGDGWDQNQWQGSTTATGLPEHHDLSRRVPQVPVFLTRVDGHAALVNKVAMDRCGINRSTPDPPGGQIIRDGSGEPTGLLLETAMELVARLVPPPTATEKREALRIALRRLACQGITSFHECGAAADDLAALDAADAEGWLTCRMHVLLDGFQKDFVDDWLRRGPRLVNKVDELKNHYGSSASGSQRGFSFGRVQVRGIKLFADGALGSRGALLSEPYTDAPTHGVEVTTITELESRIVAAKRAGFQVATHAIGDQAVKNVLKAYAKALAHEADPRALRWRVEHAQLVADEDIAEFARLGLVASVQCSHCVADASWAKYRLGTQRLASLGYRWQSFLKAGVVLCNGSDTPVEAPEPFVGMQAGVTRLGEDSQERLSRSEALGAMTKSAAYAAFWEEAIGALAPGKHADFIAVDQNPMTCPEAAIHKTRVLKTWVDGHEIEL